MLTVAGTIPSFAAACLSSNPCAQTSTTFDRTANDCAGFARPRPAQQLLTLVIAQPQLGLRPSRPPPRHPLVRAWLAKNKPITLHFTPTSGPWLNMVEIRFGITTRQAIRRSTYTSVKYLIGAIGIFIDAWNECCEPFVWTKTADEIIPRATRGKHTSIARH